jgi:hypothetical protein
MRETPSGRWIHLPIRFRKNGLTWAREADSGVGARTHSCDSLSKSSALMFVNPVAGQRELTDTNEHDALLPDILLTTTLAMQLVEVMNR